MLTRIPSPSPSPALLARWTTRLGAREAEETTRREISLSLSYAKEKEGEDTRVLHLLLVYLISCFALLAIWRSATRAGSGRREGGRKNSRGAAAVITPTRGGIEGGLVPDMWTPPRHGASRASAPKGMGEKYKPKFIIFKL